eukprot:GHVL01003948.1.p1 GENE.GHVL01003948.1~~GHVL01003948.1.p1  ORF type:complete len:2019 (+),score=209.34 GHVL01003948.1:180-6236(+)
MYVVLKNQLFIFLQGDHLVALSRSVQCSQMILSDVLLNAPYNPSTGSVSGSFTITPASSNLLRLCYCSSALLPCLPQGSIDPMRFSVDLGLLFVVQKASSFYNCSVLSGCSLEIERYSRVANDKVLIGEACPPTGALIFTPVGSSVSQNTFDFQSTSNSATSVSQLLCLCDGNAGDVCGTNAESYNLYQYQAGIVSVTSVDSNLPSILWNYCVVGVECFIEDRNALSDVSDADRFFFAITERCENLSTNDVKSQVASYIRNQDGMNGILVTITEVGSFGACLCKDGVGNFQCLQGGNPTVDNFNFLIGSSIAITAPMSPTSPVSCIQFGNCDFAAQSYTPQRDDIAFVAEKCPPFGIHQIVSPGAEPNSQGSFTFVPSRAATTPYKVCWCLGPSGQCGSEGSYTLSYFLHQIGEITVTSVNPNVKSNIHCLSSIECKLVNVNGGSNISLEDRAVFVPSSFKDCANLTSDQISLPIAYSFTPGQEGFSFNFSIAGNFEICYCRNQDNACMTGGQANPTSFRINVGAAVVRTRPAEPLVVPVVCGQNENCTYTPATYAPVEGDQSLVASECPPQLGVTVNPVPNTSSTFVFHPNAGTVSSAVYSVCWCNANEGENHCSYDSSNNFQRANFRHSIGTMRIVSRHPSIGNAQCIKDNKCLLPNENNFATAIVTADRAVFVPDRLSNCQNLSAQDISPAVAYNTDANSLGFEFTFVEAGRRAICYCRNDITSTVCLMADPNQPTSTIPNPDSFTILIGFVTTRALPTKPAFTVQCNERRECHITPQSYVSNAADAALIATKCPPTAIADVVASPVTPLSDRFSITPPAGSASVSLLTTCWCNGSSDACSFDANDVATFAKFAFSIADVKITNLFPTIPTSHCFSNEECTLINTNAAASITETDLASYVLERVGCLSITADNMAAPVIYNAGFKFSFPSQTRFEICYCNSSDGACVGANGNPIANRFELQIGVAEARTRPVPSAAQTECTESEICTYQPNNYTAKQSDKLLLSATCPPTSTANVFVRPVEVGLASGFFSFTPSSQTASFTAMNGCWCNASAGPTHCGISDTSYDIELYNLSIGTFFIYEAQPVITELIPCLTVEPCRVVNTAIFIVEPEDRIVAVAGNCQGLQESDLRSDAVTGSMIDGKFEFSLTISSGGTIQFCYCRYDSRTNICVGSNGTVVHQNYSINTGSTFARNRPANQLLPGNCNTGATCEYTPSNGYISMEGDRIVLSVNCPPRGKYEIEVFPVPPQSLLNSFSFTTIGASALPYRVCWCNGASGADFCVPQVGDYDESRYTYDIGAVTINGSNPYVSTRVHCILNETCFLQNLNTLATITSNDRAIYVDSSLASCSGLLSGSNPVPYTESLEASGFIMTFDRVGERALCFCKNSAQAPCIDANNSAQLISYSISLGMSTVRSPPKAPESIVACFERDNCIFTPVDYVFEDGDAAIITSACPPQTTEDIIHDPIAAAVDPTDNVSLSYTFAIPHKNAVRTESHTVCWCNGAARLTDCSSNVASYPNFKYPIGSVTITNTAPSLGYHPCVVGVFCRFANRNNDDGKLENDDRLVSVPESKKDCKNLKPEDISHSYNPTVANSIGGFSISFLSAGTVELCFCKHTAVAPCETTTGGNTVVDPTQFTLPIGNSVVRNILTSPNGEVSCTEAMPCTFETGFETNVDDIVLISRVCPPQLEANIVAPPVGAEVDGNGQLTRTFILQPAAGLSSPSAYRICWCNPLEFDEKCSGTEFHSRFIYSVESVIIKALDPPIPPTTKSATCNAATDGATCNFFVDAYSDYDENDSAIVTNGQCGTLVEAHRVVVAKVSGTVASPVFSFAMPQDFPVGHNVVCFCSGKFQTGACLSESIADKNTFRESIGTLAYYPGAISNLTCNLGESCIARFLQTDYPGAGTSDRALLVSTENDCSDLSNSDTQFALLSSTATISTGSPPANLFLFQIPQSWEKTGEHKVCWCDSKNLLTTCANSLSAQNAIVAFSGNIGILTVNSGAFRVAFSFMLLFGYSLLFL